MRFTKCWVLPTLFSICVATQSGCISLGALMGQSKSPTLDTSLLEAQGYSIPPGGMPAPVAPDLSGKPRVILEVREEGTHVESIPLRMDQPVFIEDIVQEARLPDRFGQLNVSIMRPTAAGGPPLRLDSHINDSGKAMNIGQNYALLPGDHIIVASDNRTSLERFIDKQFRK